MKSLKWDELKYFCNPEDIHIDHASKGKALIGQERATEAFKFGLSVREKGYNIYVSGPAGTGRTTFAKAFAREKAKQMKVPPDLCYVYNFENPKCPKLLSLPAGVGKKLTEEMNELLNRLTTELPRAFADKKHEDKKNDAIKTLKIKQDEIIREMSEEARKQDFEVKNTPSGIFFMPIIDGEVISEEQFDSLSNEQKDIISEKSETIQAKASSALREMKDFEKTARRDVEELDFSLGLFTVGHHLNPIIEYFGDNPDLFAYLKTVKEDIIENLSDFIGEDQEDEDPMQMVLPWMTKRSAEDAMTKYKVNLLTDNSALTGAPVIIDHNPSYANLVGEVEYDNEYGNFSTDFMKIKPGLFHKANGGFLILQAQDVLSSPHTWETIRRALVTGQIITEPLREYTTGIAVSGIKPEAIDLDVKIIIIGSGYYYEVLEMYDDYFEKLFKVRADFDYEMRVNDANIHEMAKFISSYAQKRQVMFDNEACARIIEYATRLAERQDRLTTRFNKLTEILTEASTIALDKSHQTITADDVAFAIKARDFRLNMYEEKLSEMIEEDTIMISTDGKKIGQINGLAVLDMGDYAFAKPSRITATTYVGKSGIVNIEKEAEMSGSIHDKGIQVLIGYLGHTYAQDFPLSLSCRICFEQNYNGIDGDSASSTELYAVLSSLSGLPIRQDIAVTGSINQYGEIQPIGGVTYKVEGFYDLCKKRGLTGSQGVMIPTRNIRDLVLKDEVIEAVKNGQFHIYPVEHVNEGLEILLGHPAGTSPYPYDTVNGKVYRKLRNYHRKALKG